MDMKDLIKISKNLKLLYVEDEEVSRLATLELLENFFTFITVAIDGKEGLEKFQEGDFDIIISDINMPLLNGIEMIEQIRVLDANVPVLILSAYNESAYLSDGIRLGVDGYIIKPIVLDNLMLTLNKICERIYLQQIDEKYQQSLEKELLKHTQELERKLYFDELTGLYNRYSFFEDIKTIDTPIVFIVDINKFKIINEIYGIDVGTLVLKKFSDFLLEFTNDSTYKAYRISGDEFIVLDDVLEINPEKYEIAIEDFLNKLRVFSVEIDGDSISIEVTIGMSTAQNDTFECAKIALEYAKVHRCTFKMYSSFIDKRSEEEDALAWKEKTKSAIADERIKAVYQPIVDKNAKIVKYETLMRLEEPGRGNLISPSYFLDTAIKTGLYDSLSSCVIFEALRVLNTTETSLSFNFTYGDIQNYSFLNEIESYFQSSPDLGKRAVFEITESESIEDYQEIKKFIKRFRVYGIRFAIDDFGSGFSNFEYILEIEPDYLKIDGSLIKNIDTDKKSHILVSAIVEFSHKLGIKIIAEYVHSEVIFDMLKELDVDEYQGYYFSEPLEHIKGK